MAWLYRWFYLFFIYCPSSSEKEVHLSFILPSWSHQREPLKTMSLLWRCSRAGEWIRTAGCILGRITLNMNSSGKPWWVCDGIWYILFMNLPTSIPTTVCDEVLNGALITDACFHIGRTFSRITWFPYPVKQMGWWIILSLYRYQVFLFTVHSLSPWAPIVRLLTSVYMGRVTLRIYCLYPSMDTCISLPITDLSQLQHLSRDTWTPPCQRAKQEVLEEVLLHTAEVRALFLQQGNFQGQKKQATHPQNAFYENQKQYKNQIPLCFFLS